MRGEVLGLIAVWAIQTAEAQSATARLFRCTVLTHGALLESGKLGPTNLTKSLAPVRREFVFDEGTQVLRWENGDLPWQYRKLQEGTDQNALVAIRILDGVASVVVDVLRIQTWREGWPFMLVEQDYVHTGKCKKF